MYVLVVAHTMPSYSTRIDRVCIKLMAAHGSSSHCLRLLKDAQMIVDANGPHDDLGRTQSHRDHHDALVAPRGSQRQDTAWRRARHHLAAQTLHDWSLLGAALQSCTRHRAHVSEVHVHACCMPSRAVREHEVPMVVKASCAEHGAVASASPRDGSWQQQVHVLIARRTTRSDLAVRSDRVHASRSNEEGYEVRSFTCAQPEGACVHRCEVRGRTASASAVRRVPDGI
jgi:hypothetical protein